MGVRSETGGAQGRHHAPDRRKGETDGRTEEEIIAADKLAELEDIYRPYKEKKKTRATEAKRKGLEPLAEYLLSFPLSGDVEAEASKYITAEPTEEMEKEGLIVKNAAEALQGAMDIIAEIVADEPKYRKWIRRFYERYALITTSLKEGAKDEKLVYGMYYDYQEAISTIKHHRVLAINRGEAEKVLKVAIAGDADRVIRFLVSRVITDERSVTAPYVKTAIEDGYRRLIKPSIEREIRAELKEKAEDQAIKVFAENLRNYLLTPPMKGKIVLGIDPAYRTGCKLAVVDVTGKVLEIGIIYPHQLKDNDKGADERHEKSKQTLLSLMKYNGRDRHRQRHRQPRNREFRRRSAEGDTARSVLHHCQRSRSFRLLGKRSGA